MKKIIFAAAAALLMSVFCRAQEIFNLNSVSLSDFDGAQAAAALPEPAPGFNKSSNLAPALDLSLKLPFALLNKRLAEMGDAKMRVIDPSLPVLSKEGDHIAFRNVTIDLNGLEVEPNILLMPFFEGDNRLAVKVLQLDVDVAFGPKSNGLPKLNKNEVMAFVVDKVTASVTQAMDNAFAINNVPLEAKDVITFSYDKPTWILRAAIAPTFISPLLPGLVDNINLTAFSIDDSGFALGVHAGVDVTRLQGYNLALSDGLLTAFLRKYTDGTDFDLAPKNYDGGVKFRADDRLELAGKARMRGLPLEPNVYFTATVLPAVTAPNTITIRFEKVDVDKAYGIGIPGFISNMLQGKIISSIVSGITGSADLAKVVAARKVDDKTVELKLKNSTFLPSFAEGASIRALKIGQGLVYIGFEF